MAPKVREDAFINTLRTRIEAIQEQSKGKAKLEDEESSDDAPKNVDQKLVWTLQRYQNEQKEDYGLDDASPLSEEISVETFPTKFKLPSLNKYDRTVDPISHLAIFRMTMQLQGITTLCCAECFR